MICFRSKNSSSDEEKSKMIMLNKKINERKTQFRELEEVLPHENGLVIC